MYPENPFLLAGERNSEFPLASHLGDALCPPFSHVHLSEGDPRADSHPDLKGLPLDSENSSFPCLQIMALLSSVNRLVSRLLVDTCPIFPGLFQFHCKGGKSTPWKGNFIQHLLPGSDRVDAGPVLSPKPSGHCQSSTLSLTPRRSEDT